MKADVARLIFGLTIVVVGAVLLLNGLGIVDTSHIVKTWWPILLVICGLTMLVNDSKNYVWALIITAAGVFIQFRVLGYYENINPWQVFWPLALIAVGVSIAMGKSVVPRARVASNNDDIVAFLGGSDHKNLSKDFQGARATVIMGGAKIDLRKAVIKKEATIDVFALMGGVELVVPRNVTVRNKTNAILGGIENKTDQDAVKDAPVVTITGDVIMGGVEIKN